MVDRERLLELRGARRRSIEPARAHRHGPRRNPRQIEQMAQADADPARIADRAVAPLRAWYARREETARIARTLVDRGDLDAGHRQQLRQRDIQPPAYRAADRQAEAAHVHARRDVAIMPADEEPVVGGEDLAVQRVHRRLEQRRAGALQDHVALAGIAAGCRSSIVATRQAELDQSLGPGRDSDDPRPTEPDQAERTATIQGAPRCAPGGAIPARLSHWFAG